MYCFIFSNRTITSEWKSEETITVKKIIAIDDARK